MKNFCLVFVLFLSFSTVLEAQELSDLIKRLENVEKELNQVPLLLQIARVNKDRSNYQDAAINYFKAQSILQKEGLKGKLAETYDEIGLLYQEWEGYESSAKYFLKADTIKQSLPETDLQGRVNSLENAAFSYYRIKKYIPAQNTYEKILPLLESLQAKKEQARILNRLAIISEKKGEYSQALEYLNQSRILYQDLGDSQGEAITLNNIAYLYRDQGERKKALQSFEEARKFNQLQLKKNSNPDEQVVLLNNLGVIQSNLRNYASAQTYYQQAFKINNSRGDTRDLANSHNFIAANFFLSGSNDKARQEVLEKAIPLATRANAKDVLKDSYDILARIYENEGVLTEYRKYNELSTKLQKELDKARSDKEQELINRKSQIQLLESQIKLSQSQNENQKLALEKAKAEQERLQAEADKQKAEVDKQKAEAEQAFKQAQINKLLAEEAGRKEALAKAEAAKQKAEADQQKAEAAKQKAEADKQKAEADRQKAEADRQKLLVQQAESEKDRLKNEKEQQQWTYFLIGIIGLFILVILFVLFFNYKNQQKNRLLTAKNEKIQEQNVVLEQKKLEIEEQRDNLIEMNEEINQQKEEIEAQRDVIDNEKQKADQLLLNILPQQTAMELKEFGRATPRHYELVSVLFTDFKGFTNIAAKLTPEEVIQELDYCFQAFDGIIEKYNLEKIKTIGDAYMCAGGIPTPNTSNPIDAVKAGLEIQDFMQKLKEEKLAQGKESWEIRLGIHTGVIVAGVVGKKKFAYDIWGDAVNTASRMESSGIVGRVNISGVTYDLVKDQFDCTYRGKVPAKNKGDVDMYLVDKAI